MFAASLLVTGRQPLAFCRCPSGIGLAKLLPLPDHLRRLGWRADRGHSSPVHWKLASLPRALKPDEVQRLLGAFTNGRWPRRGYAIVRCALDMGLRAGEIAASLDRRRRLAEGTVTLRGTKSLRQDILPLPMETGQALADYLQHERPRSRNPAIFVRCREDVINQITSMAIQKVIKRAGRRIGLSISVRMRCVTPWPAAWLRTAARSRRLLTYCAIVRWKPPGSTPSSTRRNLAGVALPWPGSGS